MEQMRRMGAEPKNLCAAIGPCIQKESYQVGEDMRQQFLQSQTTASTYFQSRDDRFVFDLSGFIVNRLRHLEVEQVECCAIDTYRDAERFFSYRRAQKHGQKDYGCQLSLIACVV